MALTFSKGPAVRWRPTTTLLAIGVVVVALVFPARAEARTDYWNCYPNLNELFADRRTRSYLITAGTAAAIGTVMALVSKGKKGNKVVALATGLVGGGLTIGAFRMPRTHVVDSCTQIAAGSYMSDQAAGLMGVGIGMMIGGVALASRTSPVGGFGVKDKDDLTGMKSSRVEWPIGFTILPSSAICDDQSQDFSRRLKRQVDR